MGPASVRLPGAARTVVHAAPRVRVAPGTSATAHGGAGPRSRRVTRCLAVAAALPLAASGIFVARAAAQAPSAPAPAALSESGAAASCPRPDPSIPVSQRVSELISAMTLDQKIAEMHAFQRTTTGRYAGYEGYVPAHPALCIPALTEQDDSLGVAAARGVTQLPDAVALASAWNPSLA